MTVQTWTVGLRGVGGAVDAAIKKSLSSLANSSTLRRWFADRALVQSAAERADPLEIRIYGGNDADFELYEDSCDSDAYEHGANATIHLHWDDDRKVLLIGDRSGTFQGMLMKQTLQIVLVTQGHGIG